MHPLPIRQGEEETGPAHAVALGPDSPAVIADDLRHDRQPKAGALQLANAADPLERLEHLLTKLRREADPVVLDEVHVLFLTAAAAHLDARRLARPGELHRIGEQVAIDAD